MATVAAAQDHIARNPLDLMEEIVLANEWPFERTNEAEMMVQFSGHWCEYQLYFAWSEDLGAMHFSSIMDMRVPATRVASVYELLATINMKIWLGHFELTATEKVPLFRHTILLRGARGASVEQLEDLVDIGLNECERFYPAFQFVVWGGKNAAEAVEASMLDTKGEA